MARFTKTIILPPVDLKCIAESTTQYLFDNGFKSVPYKNAGLFYKKDGGLFEGPQYMKFGVKTGQMTIEAFVKFPLLPGIAIGEMGIIGSFCPVMKTGLTRSINNLQTHVRKTVKKFQEDNPELRQYPNVYYTIS